MSKVLVVFRRELRSYFATPLAYVFIVIFLVLAAVFTFQVGGFFERGQADLQPFFRWHPWLYLVLIPAISMRLWAEERNSGSIELLMTLPLTLWQAVVGKFLAAWVFAGIALVLDFVRGVLPQAIVDAIASLSFFTHFEAISKGVIDLRDLVYFGALIGFWLAATALVLDMKKAE